MPPRGKRRPALPREFIALHKRGRIMAALAQLTAEKGYEATKISDVVKRAAVARKTLYDNFAGKEEVFLAAFDGAVEEAERKVRESCAANDGDWEGGAEAGLEAFLGYVAEEPALAQMCLVEALSATPATCRRYEAALRRFVRLTKQALPREEGMPDTMEETMVGGVAWIVYQQVRRGEAERALDLLPELREFLLAPYRGAALAEGAGKRG